MIIVSSIIGKTTLIERNVEFFYNKSKNNNLNRFIIISCVVLSYLLCCLFLRFFQLSNFQLLEANFRVELNWSGLFLTALCAGIYSLFTRIVFPAAM